MVIYVVRYASSASSQIFVSLLVISTSYTLDHFRVTAGMDPVTGLI